MSGLFLSKYVSYGSLRQKAVCPNCWQEFPAERVLFVSTDPNLEPDTNLPAYASGRREAWRFIPERFNAAGKAIDPLGSPCVKTACPHCRLTIPQISLELPSIVLSVLGAKSSGKSVFLASMIHSLRQRASRLGVGFYDADLSLNESLILDEQRLFSSLDAEGYRRFSEVVQQTQVEDGESWRQTIISGTLRRYLPPYTFRFAATDKHVHKDEKNMEFLLCLYDNAGEHFDYRTSQENKYMTGHLAQSKGILFTFDPTQDRRFRRLMKNAPTATVTGTRQDIFLSEAANRIRENSLRPLGARDPIPQRVVVVLTKFDMWMDAIEDKLPSSLFRRISNEADGTDLECMLTEDLVRVSDACRELLRRRKCNEIVDTAEAISRDVLFCPVASVGTDVKLREDGLQEFKLDDSSPIWAEVPLLLLLNRAHPKLFPLARKQAVTEPNRSIFP